MKLIFIYGPPGVGKLTVATELARLTGFKLWDNHKSIDAVVSVFPFGTEPFNRLRDRIRGMVFQEVAEQNVDLIYTMVYDHPYDIPYVGFLLDPIEKRSGVMHFVQLLCSREENHTRVIDPSRVNKINSVELLRDISNGHDFTTPIPGWESLQIDNSDLSAEGTAGMIAEHFGLTSASHL